MPIRLLASLLPVLLMLARPALGESVVATHTIRSQTILTANDVNLIDTDIAGTYLSPAEVIGMEARVVLYAGRPIRIDDIGPPAVIERNQIVTLYYSTGGLMIAADARALGRAGIGDALRVMNLASRSTVTGWVQQDGSVSVGHPKFPTQ
ncbi:MAG: flagellar basal body P-ring formation protein FlgA [Rhodobacteraceae bacterium]|nr:flagellar basal body P-ring formation protein FlgA [Paracoccaceae bacterium]